MSKILTEKSKFDTDKEAVLDMLKGLAIIKLSETIKKSKTGKFDISIFPSDLHTYGISFDRCVQLLYLLKNERTIVDYSYDQDDFMIESASDNNPSCFDVILPYNFSQYLEKTPNHKNGLKINFDRESRVLEYGKIRHNFQKDTISRANKRFGLFDILWPDRKYKKKGKIKSGKRHPYGFLAVKIRISGDRGAFDRNSKHKKELKNLIKGINKDFEEKGLPLKIDRGNGAQLIDIS